MNKRINLFSLINTISSQTGQDPELVERFVLQLFKEIEKELTTSSYTKIDGLGMFRVIKSLPNDRILFLSYFESDKKIIEIKDNEYNTDEIEVIGQHHQSNESDNNELTSFYEETVIAHNNTDEEEFVTEEKQLSSDKDKEISDFLYEYKNHEIEENKRRKFSKIRIVFLFILTLIGVSALLIFFYPKENKDDLSAPIATAPHYISLENNDTINWLQIIEAEAELDFVALSQDFYGYGIFWPYIYEANKKEIPSPFGIRKGTVVKIPKLDKELINKDNKESVNKADSMSNEIIKLRDNTVTN